MLSIINFVAITSFIALCNKLRLIKWSVTGVDNLPPRPQGMVIVCNHIQWHDIPLIGWGLPLSHRPWWLAKVEIVNSLFGRWFTMMQVIPVKRGQRDIQAIDRAADCARNGGVVVIFPEGTRNHTGAMLQGRGGTARIALRGGVPIVPMVIMGTQRKFWFSTRQLIIGKPYYPEVREGDASSEKIPASEMSRLTNEIMFKMCELLPPDYHGYYRELMQEYQKQGSN